MTDSEVSPVDLRAGVYARESQGNEDSIASQNAQVERRCERESWSITARYSDGTSASRFQRKTRGDWPKLVADVEAGRLDVIVLWESSRGDRTLTTWSAFLDLCRTRGVLIRVEAHGRTYDVRNPRDWRSLAEDGVDAAGESEKISQRSRRGQAFAASEGKPAGKLTYGYDREYHPRTRELVRQYPHPDQAPVVESIIRRVAQRVPLTQIVRELDESGVPAPLGGLWGLATVRRIARNPAYVGLRRHYTQLYPAVWPAIVERAEFEAAQRVLAEPDRKQAPPGALRYLLSCIVTAPCQRPVYGFSAPGYGTPRYMCNLDGCVSIAIPPADVVIRTVLTQMLAADGARQLLVYNDDEQARTADAEVDRLTRELDEARDSYYHDGISAVALAGKEKALMPRIEQARERARRAARVTGLAELIVAGEQGGVARAEQVWDALSLPARRTLIRTLVTVRLLPAPRRLSRWTTDEQRLMIARDRLVIAPVTG
jgi:DNA invertase Pin-like site-specific DNA recombinase